MFDMFDLSDLPNKVTYCNWRTGNYKFSHNHNIVNFIYACPAGDRPSNSPPTFPIAMGDR